MSCDRMSASAAAWNTIGPACAQRATCSTCSLPPCVRSSVSSARSGRRSCWAACACVLTVAGRARRRPRRSRGCRRSRSGCPRSRRGPMHAREVLDRRRAVRASPARRRRLSPGLGREEQRCANGSQVEPSIVGSGVAVGVRRREHRHPVRGVGVEVDARDEACARCRRRIARPASWPWNRKWCRSRSRRRGRADRAATR